MKDFTYAKKKDERKSRRNKKWYIIYTKKYSYYIWAAPLIPIFELKDIIKQNRYNKRVWDEEKAKKVLDHTLPYFLNYNDDEDAYFFNKDWGCESAIAKKSPLHLRKWANKFSFDIIHYLVNSYQKDGYVKTIEEDWFDIWVKFKKEN